MTTPATLDDLIARIESASESSWELDAEIEWTISEFKNLGGGWREHKTTGERERFDYTLPSPRFTRSLDAAMTLIPDGSFWTLLTGGSLPEYQADVVFADDCRELVYSLAATPALALCAAALKARRS
jgi:hypothetical protein